MGVAVTVRLLFGNYLGRRYATIQILASDMFELDRRMADLIPVAEKGIEIDEDARAL